MKNVDLDYMVKEVQLMVKNKSVKRSDFRELTFSECKEFLLFPFEKLRKHIKDKNTDDFEIPGFGTFKFSFIREKKLRAQHEIYINLGFKNKAEWLKSKKKKEYVRV